MKAFLVNLLPSFFVKFFAHAYVSGVGIDSALEKARTLWVKDKIASSIDMLGEEVTNTEDVEKIVQIYFDLINKLAKEDFPKHISLKLTSLGVDIDKTYCINNLTRILEKARENGVFVTLDMERSNYTSVILEIYKNLRNQYEFGTVLQTRLFRTKDDILGLKRLQTRIRLCVGVYNEDKTIAYTKKSVMKEKLIEYLTILLENNHQVDVATHDHKYIIQALQEIERRNINPSQVEFQFLLGVPRARIQKELIDRGYLVRLYVPFTIEWKYAISYLRRRLKENPSLLYLGGLDFIGRIIQPFTWKKRKLILSPKK